MTLQEFTRLHAYHSAHRRRPTTDKIGRRFAKGKAKHVGVQLKNSKVFSSSMEKLYHSPHTYKSVNNSINSQAS